MKEITFKESRKLKNSLYIDVRSPGEFSDDHIPGATNLPIFDDKERREIGTIYKMAGKDSAIIKGTEIVGNKLGTFVPDILKHKDKNIIIYCYRGGMRSSSIAGLINTLGIKVYKLDKGYKGYRNYIIEKFDFLNIKPEIIILQGLTGTGKTELIEKFHNSINLEKMAGHRSSIFGAIGLKQNTQKMFESLLLKKIEDLKEEEYILVEGESQKIGNLHIPQIFFDLMRKSPAILIKLPIEERAKLLVKEYTKNIDENHTAIVEIVGSLNEKLGEKYIKKLKKLLDEKNYSGFTENILEKYYDPRYKHKLDKMNFIFRIDNFDIMNSVKIINRKIKKYLVNNP